MSISRSLTFVALAMAAIGGVSAQEPVFLSLVPVTSSVISAPPTLSTFIPSSAPEPPSFTSTFLTTITDTISSCAPEVTSCPYGSTTVITSSGTVVITSSSVLPPYPTPSSFIVSTALTTITYTISSCAPTVPNCPYGSTTVVTSALTTLVPLTPTSPGLPVPTGAVPSTVYSTTTYTITSCAPTVTNCPYGSTTTRLVSLYTTYCPATTSTLTPFVFSGTAPTPFIPVTTSVPYPIYSTVTKTIPHGAVPTGPGPARNSSIPYVPASGAGTSSWNLAGTAILGLFSVWLLL